MNLTVHSSFLLCILGCLGCEGSIGCSNDPSRVRESGGAASGGTRATVASGGTSLGGTTNRALTTTSSSTTGGTSTGTSSATGGDHNASTATTGASSATGGTSTTGASSATGGTSTTSPDDCSTTSALGYDQMILCEHPVAYWAMTGASENEADLSSNGNDGHYRGGIPSSTTLPNGDRAVAFDGESQYLTIASSARYSIPTTGDFAWEAWIQPSVLQFPNDGGAGYVDWMGKCAEYAPTCEWEARMYSTTNDEKRCNRISAYVFNPSAGLGSAADFQPTCGLIQAGAWYHVVGAYTLTSQPSTCAEVSNYPGSIEIWVNGVKWNQSRHGQTGCMSQYNVVPKAGNSPVNIGTMAGDGWFPGSVAKVAFYDYQLSQLQVERHYSAMTGKPPSGSCTNDCTF